MIEKLKSNLESVQNRIGLAAEKSGRNANDICLIGVTKYVNADTTRAMFDAGCENLGESRPQVLWDKSQSLAELPVRWHMIGHLQRNKVKRTVACCELIHSVDSQRLIQTIDDAGKEHNNTVNILLEVNISGESAKHGFTLDQIPSVLEFVSCLSHVSVNGLMGMAGLAGNQDDARREFASLSGLKQKLELNSPDNVQMNELSMGMSRDFEIAIEEGATIVRVGSALFEGVS